MLPLTAELNLGCFSQAYAAARQQFIDTCRQLPTSLQRDLLAYPHPLAGPAGETLACDVALLGQQSNPERLLVLISGTHGVEGFAGSAIQVDVLPLLAEVLAAQPSLGAVVLHAFNPWGFAWLRRYDHEGIDLNRNFVDFSEPLPENPEYDLLHAQLTDPALLQMDDLAALWQQPGLSAFTEIVTRGQYRHADGCFFGGRQPSWSRQMLGQLTEHPWFGGAGRIAVLDLHTGLGPYGYGELINDHVPGSAGDRYVTQWYGDNACSAQLGESVSTMKHGLLDFFWHDLVGDRGCFVTLEFGTYPVERLLSALLREQVYQASVSQSGASRDPSHPAVVALRDFFYSQEPSWQQQVLFRGRQAVSMALAGLMHE